MDEVLSFMIALCTGDPDWEDKMDDSDEDPIISATRYRRKAPTQNQFVEMADHVDTSQPIQSPDKVLALKRVKLIKQLRLLVKEKKSGRARRSTAVTGSAALALIASRKDDDSSNDELEGSTGTRKRKNSVIPIPVPVPNLTKKSRGRKVPVVAIPVASSNDEGKGAVEDAIPPPRKRKKRGETVSSNGVRSFICPECGKCFVRGAHLKVRSHFADDRRFKHLHRR